MLIFSTSLVIIGSAFIIYGLRIKKRLNCIICENTPPCFINSNCLPNNIEGYFFYYLSRYIT
jgi:hypothetical protein